jgi:hypothetical protein
MHSKQCPSPFDPSANPAQMVTDRQADRQTDVFEIMQEPVTTSLLSAQDHKKSNIPKECG